MRLISIKLSGFKSFVEPAQFELPGQRIGVVGPNGCGKSNIIDAVRWVLGESRASELRGESMQDVIFNGTTTRKPASRASVELLFDNSAQRVGGQWGSFAEIAVKRVLTRDGVSSYFINNQAVRRRDVQDVFMGTGLGPRAYAIIGQGTISRIIESRPEDLRLFMEEAAGVSRYKERRRETQNRIEDTEENLTRVCDIVREVNATLEKLERQAQQAQKYQALHAEVTLKQQQQWFLREQESAQTRDRFGREVAQALNALEEQLTRLRRVETELELIRQQHYSAADELNVAQGLLYEVNSEVGRIEAQIRFVVEGRRRAQERIAQIAMQVQQWQERQTLALAQLAELDTLQAGGAQQMEVLQTNATEIAQRVAQQERALQTARGRAMEALTGVNEVQQQIQVLIAQQEHLRDQLRQLEQRRERIVQQQHALVPPEQGVLARLSDEHAAAREALAQAQQVLNTAQEQYPRAQAARAQAQQEASEASAKQSDLQARLQALQALQAQVIANDKLNPWLARQGLTGVHSLWTRLQVEKGWEVALEAALRERIRALETSRLETVAALAQEAPPARLTFFSNAVCATPAQGQALTPAPALPVQESMAAEGARALKPMHHLLRTGEAGQAVALQDWLAYTFVAQSLHEALQLRAQLREGEQIYTPQGHCVSATSLSFYAPEGEATGLLARAQEIENLQRQCRAQELMAVDARAALLRAESHYASVGAQVQDALAAVRHAQGAEHEAALQHTAMHSHVQQMHERAQRFDVDRTEVETQLAALQERMEGLERQFEGLDLQLAAAQQGQEELDAQERLAERELVQVREQQRALERQVQELHFEDRARLARKEELTRSVTLGRSQLEQLEQEHATLHGQLEQLEAATAQEGLQEALALKAQRESQLGARRSLYDDLTQKLRTTDESRLSEERALEPMRARISGLQLKEQAAHLGAEQYAQMLREAKADTQAVAESVERSGVKLWGLQGEIDRLNESIQSLGAINLAALEELATERERKSFLDAQSADLSAALATLKEAIATIDGQTRELLGNTFNQVNDHFGRMFPQLFGGGCAQLIMSGAEVLDAGIEVMAQPPGKRNQTIHLLSGGEKALTAIALVFAIFQLNPAPFCLLDEVDAPLDDANTERYVDLVTSMSEQTQFLFISHNKIAMEMAQQLIGVTMQEQGVSRIVAVDMQSALEMTETS